MINEAGMSIIAMSTSNAIKNMNPNDPVQYWILVALLIGWSCFTVAALWLVWRNFRDLYR